MAHRRCLHALTRHAAALLSSTPPPPPPPPSLLETPFSTLKPLFISLKTQKPPNIFWPAWWGSHTRHFSSNRNDGSENEDEIEEISDCEEENDDDDDEEEEEEEEEDGDYGNTASGLAREYSVEEKEAEAAAIGYKVVGPLEKSDRVFKQYEPVFAVVQIGSHQFKVSNGDCIFTEKLKFCEVNDKLILNKVLLVGSASQTIIGRPIVPDAAVHAVVEEHALDAKVIIFKKKRRKNYRRTKGHRQELTKLRITDIQGIEKPEMKVEGKPSKAAAKKAEKVAVAA